MCLIGLHINNHPTYKLIIAANRDEAYERPTAPAKFWEDYPNVLAGRDLMHQGTWLGITKQGRVAALTNYRNINEMNSDKLSRGNIVKDFLINNDFSAETYLETLRNENEKYNGFNTIVGSVDHLYYYGNYQSDIIKLSPGTHGLSNDILNTPWPKVTTLKAKLDDYITNYNNIEFEQLFRILKTDNRAHDDELPHTGVGIELERKLSPIFITMPHYGTRSSTVILVTHDNDITFIERTYSHTGDYTEEKYRFKLKNE